MRIALTETRWPVNAIGDTKTLRIEWDRDFYLPFGDKQTGAFVTHSRRDRKRGEESCRMQEGRGASLSYLEPFPVNLGPLFVVITRTRARFPTPTRAHQDLAHTRAQNTSTTARPGVCSASGACCTLARLCASARSTWGYVNIAAIFQREMYP